MELADRLTRTFLATSGAGDRCTAASRSSRPTRTGTTCCCSTSTSTATTAPASAPAIRPAGPGPWRCCARWARAAGTPGADRRRRRLMRLPARPTVYELNTAVWLERLGRARGRPLTLGEVADGEWDALAALPVDAVWLMGVWQRSPAGLRIALADPALDRANRAALPDLRAEDVIGSPYCVRDYEVDERFGGPAGLARAREQLARRGLGLILDYVPNHVAPDHPWTASRPECLLAGTEAEAAEHPEAFLRTPAGIVARGRDPVLPAVARRRAAERVLARAARRRRRNAGRHRPPVRRAALRHGDADDQRGVRAHVGQPPRTRSRGGLLAGALRPRQTGAPRPAVHRRGLLGHGVDAPAARIRPLLRQAPLRPPGARPRRIGARPPPSRRRLPGAPAPVRREPRRAARRRHVRSRPGARGRRRDVDAAGRAPLPRRPARGAPDAHPSVPRARARRARTTANCARSTPACSAPSPTPACAPASGACASAPAGPTTTPFAPSSRGAGRTPSHGTSWS